DGGDDGNWQPGWRPGAPGARGRLRRGARGPDARGRRGAGAPRGPLGQAQPRDGGPGQRRDSPRGAQAEAPVHRAPWRPSV
ncbi:MAG: hypothetical protein AVDCRST_MAG12-879, partial [uncultured Rubrobacteraceae bacterium]